MLDTGSCGSCAPGSRPAGCGIGAVCDTTNSHMPCFHLPIMEGVSIEQCDIACTAGMFFSLLGAMVSAVSGLRHGIGSIRLVFNVFWAVLMCSGRYWVTGQQQC